MGASDFFMLPHILSNDEMEAFYSMLQKYMKYRYGPPAAFSEYQVGDVIDYLKEGQKKSGTIVWVCAPRRIGSIYVGIAYIVRTLNSNQLERIRPANTFRLSEYQQD